MGTKNSHNLKERFQERLPDGLYRFITRAGEIAQRRGQRLYLVGGAVRDILLGRSTLDIDLVTEGNAIALAQLIAGDVKGKVTAHSRFGTARLDWDDKSVDFVTARSETYSRPGALPKVASGTIADDLARRDFTINALAICLTPSNFGELYDPHKGRRDIERRLVRVLHDKSFIDDATRIWRALRYEQRLDFELESKTRQLLRRDIPRLATISGDRIRHEIERILREELPEKVFIRAGKLGVLRTLHPALKGDDWLTETFEKAREQSLPDSPHPDLYLALLTYRLSRDETEQLISTLKLPKTPAGILRETVAIREISSELSTHGLAPSAIYRLLHGHSLVSLTANLLATGSPTAAEHIELYLNVLRHVNPVLTGADLIKLGIPRGERIKDIRIKLREARLDGRIGSREDEEAMVRELRK